MNPALQPFLTVALPIIITLILAMWTNNGRLAEISARLTDLRGDMNRRFEEVNVRLERIEHKLDGKTHSAFFGATPAPNPADIIPSISLNASRSSRRISASAA